MDAIHKTNNGWAGYNRRQFQLDRLNKCLARQDEVFSSAGTKENFHESEDDPRFCCFGGDLAACADLPGNDSGDGYRCVRSRGVRRQSGGAQCEHGPGADHRNQRRRQL